MTAMAIRSLLIQDSQPQRLKHACRLWNIFDFAPWRLYSVQIQVSVPLLYSPIDCTIANVHVIFITAIDRSTTYCGRLAALSSCSLHFQCSTLQYLHTVSVPQNESLSLFGFFKHKASDSLRLWLVGDWTHLCCWARGGLAYADDLTHWPHSARPAGAALCLLH